MLLPHLIFMGPCVIGGDGGSIFNDFFFVIFRFMYFVSTLVCMGRKSIHNQGDRVSSLSSRPRKPHD